MSVINHRQKLILQEILSMSRETDYLKNCHQRFILLSTSLKGQILMYICSSGEKEFKSILDLCNDFLKNWNKKNDGQPKPRLFTVGRLDVATTGLIIVTNDGDFAQRVSHPSSNLTKEYIATVNDEVHKRHLVSIGQGTIIDGVHCTPEYVELLPRQPDIPRARLRIVVNEGRNHEVRELVKSAGLEIHSLKRIRIGGYRLSADLGLGKYVALKENDLKALGWEK